MKNRRGASGQRRVWNSRFKVQGSENGEWGTANGERKNGGGRLESEDRIPKTLIVDCRSDMSRRDYRTGREVKVW